ncbi:OmpH family outer membrane protein [Christiangramia echinicola]|uniref:Periplasmic chaperone for outer membrane proteins Skp n=1 Tax=Christiangramia echinicola TaxID=279359 RepID=A0A1H1PQJ5_9FLAO|nr:OmpH family outer membrane protein [Christiangramia echinicola]SDS13400.1 periplasmic chaperone for outer membrane proteins Skp [Christiangramia echinicola]
MKRLSLAILMMLVAFSSNAQSKIGTIDAEYILSQLPESAEVNKSLETYNEKLQADLKSTIQEYEGLVKEYQESVASLEEEAKKEKENKIIDLENNIKGFRQKASVMMQMKRSELNGPLYDKIDAAMQKVIKADGFTQIFHSGASGLAYSRPEDDITEKVMNQLGIEPQPAEDTAENK